MMTNKDKVYAIIALDKAQDKLDDGYHNACIAEIVRVKNAIFAELPQNLKASLQEWYDKQTEEADVPSE